MPYITKHTLKQCDEYVPLIYEEHINCPLLLPIYRNTDLYSVGISYWLIAALAGLKKNPVFVEECQGMSKL